MAERGEVEKIVPVAQFRLHVGPGSSWTTVSREEFRRIWEAGNTEFRVEASHNGQPCYYQDLESKLRIEVRTERERKEAATEEVKRLREWLKKIRDSEKMNGYEILYAYKMCVHALAGQQPYKENS